MSGCGGGSCTCGGVQPQPAAVNGIALHPAGERLEEEELRERAWAELLRQEAVRAGRLPRHTGLAAPAIGAPEQEAIQRMLDEEVPLRQPDEAECARYYAAHATRFRPGRQVRVRHILFAVTQGVDVTALAARAEQALLELTRADVAPERFAALARELSNCPSGQEGGELGWIGPEELAPELTRAWFEDGDAPAATGLLPRLVHSRYGFHVVEILERKPGREVGYTEVRARIEAELAQRARATALHQYIRLLAGRARLEGVELEAADSPLLQ